MIKSQIPDKSRHPPSPSHFQSTLFITYNIFFPPPFPWLFLLPHHSCYSCCVYINNNSVRGSGKNKTDLTEPGSRTRSVGLPTCRLCISEVCRSGLISSSPRPRIRQAPLSHSMLYRNSLYQILSNTRVASSTQTTPTSTYSKIPKW